jgi:uncharacterized protein (TIGR00661 family)
MRILYGVQTTGHGHIVRATELIGTLRELGHEVRPLLSGRPLKGRWGSEVLARPEVRRGMTFLTHRGRVRILETGLKLGLGRFFYDVLRYDPRGLDLVITDFEPVSALVAWLHGIPSIGIGHLYAFVYDVPISGKNPLARLLMRSFAAVDHPLGLHWHHFGEPILPPTIPRHVRSNGRTVPGKVLVYLPFEGHEEVMDFLRGVDDCRFFVYSRVPAPSEEGHIHLRPYDRRGFVEDLAECEGVFCNAGFSLISEALHLGTKVLAKPVLKQVEQQSNALALRELDLGTIMQEMDARVLREWLDRDPPAAQHYPDVLASTARWIDARCWDDKRSLVDEVWGRSWSAGGTCVSKTV